MIKKKSLFLVFALGVLNTTAQNQFYQKGQGFICFGGIYNDPLSGPTAYDYFFRPPVIPMAPLVKTEYALTHRIGISLLYFQQYHQKRYVRPYSAEVLYHKIPENYPFTCIQSIYGIVPQITWHYNPFKWMSQFPPLKKKFGSLRKLDFYVGCGLGTTGNFSKLKLSTIEQFTEKSSFSYAEYFFGLRGKVYNQIQLFSELGNDSFRFGVGYQISPEKLKQIVHFQP